MIWYLPNGMRKELVGTGGGGGGTVVTDGDYGDVIVSGIGTVWTIDADSVDPSKMSNAPALSVLGNPTNTPDIDPSYFAASLDGQVLLRAANLLRFGPVNLASPNAITGDLPLSNVAASASAIRLLGRGDTGAGDWQPITLGTNLSFTPGTATLNATGGGGGTPLVTLGGDLSGNATPPAVLDAQIVPLAVGTPELADHSVTFVKMIAPTLDSTLIGCPAGGGTGDFEQVTTGSGLVWVGTTLTAVVTDGDKGDITVSSGGTNWQIDANAVTNAELSDMPTQTVKGRVAALSGDPANLTKTELTTLVNTFTTTLSGAVPAPLAVAGKVLSDNGTWITPAGGGVTPGDKGDIFVADPATDWQIKLNSVTNSELANMNPFTIKGNNNPTAEDPFDLSTDQVVQMLPIFGTVTGNMNPGLVPTGATATAASTKNRFLCDNAVWRGLTLTGDVTGTYTDGTWTTSIAANAVGSAEIANDAVTYAKLQNTSAGNVVLTRADTAAGDYGETALAASRLLGRGSTGNIAAITIGTGLTMTGTTLEASGGGGGAPGGATGTLQYNNAGAFGGIPSTTFSGTMITADGTGYAWVQTGADTQPFVWINRGGNTKAIEFGTGASATPDISIRRVAGPRIEVTGGHLQTDFANGYAVILPVQGGSFSDTDIVENADGVIGINSATELLEWRVNGTWTTIPLGGGSPDDAEYLVAASHGDLTGARVATDTTTISWDFGDVGQAEANVNAASIAPSHLTAAARKRQITFSVGNGVDDLAAIADVLTARLVMGYGFTITSWYLIADAAGSITLDVLGDNFSAYPATGSIIGAGTKPSLSSATKANGTPTSWTAVTGAIGTVLGIEIEAVSGIKWFQLVLSVEVN